MVCLFAFAVRLRCGAHKLPLVGSHDTSIGKVLIQDLSNERLRRLSSISADWLPRSRKRSLGWAVRNGKHHSLGGRHALGRRRDPISILGDYTKVELLLRLFWDGQAQSMA